MDIKEHLERLKDLAHTASAEAALEIRIPAANRLLANTKNRIINEGKATDGSRIGNYSTRPLYASKKSFVKKGAFKPQGKTGVAKFSNGKARKSMYLPGGYAQFRQIQGREAGFVNAELSGDLMLSYVSAPQQNADIVQGLNTELSVRKRAGLERRFKPFLASTKDEIQDFNKECAVGFAELTVKTLR